MSCTVTVDGPCRRTLSFSVERAVLDQEIETAVDELARTVRLKGFRPGKVPRDLIRRTRAKQLAEDARRKIMSEAFRKAVQENHLRPVGDPEMNLEVLNDDGEGPFTFEFAVEVAPEIDLQLPEQFPVTIVLPAVTEEMVEAEVSRIREQAAHLEDAAEDATVGPEDILEGTVVYVVEDQELEPRPDRAVFVKHDLVDGLTVEGSAERFEGHRKGDTVELEVQLPETFDPAALGGKPATLRFTIDRHRKVVPAELDEELLGKLGVDSEDALRERIRQGLAAQRARFRDEQIDHEIEKQLLQAHDFELPERLLDRTVDRRVHEVAHRMMKEQGLSAEEGHTKADERREEIATATRDGLRLAFLLGHVARTNGLEAGLDAAQDQVRTLAAQQRADPDQLLRESIQEGWLMDVQEQLTQQNARDWLRARAHVTETEPAPRAPENEADDTDQEPGT